MCRAYCRTKTSSTFYNSICLFIASTYYALWKWYIFVCTTIIIAYMQTFGIIVDWTVYKIYLFRVKRPQNLSYMCNNKIRLCRQIAQFVELSPNIRMTNTEYTHREMSTHKKREMNGR